MSAIVHLYRVGSSRVGLGSSCSGSLESLVVLVVRHFLWSQLSISISSLIDGPLTFKDVRGRVS
jgi:hypothetical protein